MTRPGAIVAAAFVVLWAGCSSIGAGRGVPTLNAPPARWAAAAGSTEEPVEAWWTSLGDPGLARTVEEVIAASPEIAAAVARLEAARAEAGAAGAERWPSLEAGLGAARQRRNFLGLPLPGAGGGIAHTTTTTLGVSLNTSWELDLWGRLRAAHAAARARVQATEADLVAARLSLAGQAAKAWLAATEARLQARLLDDVADGLRASLEDVQGRHRLGLASAAVLERARGELALGRSAVRARRAVERGQVAALEALLGRYPAGEVALGEDLPWGLAPVAAGLPADLVARRADLAAAERRVAAADAGLARSRAELLPRVALTASGGTASEDLSDVLDGDFGVWALAANLARPVLEGGRLRAGVDRARAGQAEARARYVAAALRAYAEVEAALALEGELAAEEAELGRAMEAARAAEAVARGRYRGGLVGLEVLRSAERGRREALSRLLAVRGRRLDNRVDLLLALGGGAAEGGLPWRAR
ncbi:MAG: efflux transporter outer membrane subunit [Planctomycetes bacterium]|nr:efflux transporter outer membrane subunit [Planctomycetota bacterium]